MTMELRDARGVEITAGDTVIYGFGVGRSVAMAEGIVLQSPTRATGQPSVTATGRIRIRVVRRSYGGGEKPVVDLAPDRVVVLKPGFNNEGSDYDPDIPTLPPSPLPTQDEGNTAELIKLIKLRETRLAELEAGNELEGWEARTSFDWSVEDRSPERREYVIQQVSERLAEDRAKLAATEKRIRDDG